VLIIRPSALGDVCRSVALAASVRAAWPSARVTWLVQDTFADAVRCHPCVDEVLAFPRGAFRRWWRPSVAAAALRWLRSLKGRFDVAIDAQGLGRSGLMAWASRAPRRIGFRDARELGWLGANERYAVPATHSVDRMLGLLAAAGVEPRVDMRLVAPPECVAWWEAERARRGIGAYAVCAPTSRWASKDWPSERWAALAPRLFERGLERAVYVGTTPERDAVRLAMPSGAAGERCVDLSGATTVGQSMAVIAGADLVVANDSAPLHIAVGFGRPLVALFGPTDPAKVGPYRRESTVLRSVEATRFTGSYRDPSIGDRLMRGISVDDVLAAIDQGRAAPPAATTSREGHGRGLVA
jgi:heptosyltransferase-1